MRLETTTRNLYKFDELSEEAQEKVYDKFMEWNYQDWPTLVDEQFQEYALEEAHKKGIHFNTVYYSLDRSNYILMDKPYFFDLDKFFDYSKCKDKKALILLKECQCRITQSKYSNSIEFYIQGITNEKVESRMFRIIEDHLQPSLDELLIEWMQFLRGEEEYITSKDYIKEQIEANAYEFTVDGDLA